MGTCLVQTAHVRESRCRLLELTFLKLRLTQQQPRLPDERVIFATVQPFYVLCRFPASLRPFRLTFDAMTANGFLRLLNGTVELTGTDRTCLFVAHSIEGQQFRIIVLVSLLLFLTAIDKSL